MVRGGGAGRQAGYQDLLAAGRRDCPPAVLHPSGRQVRARRLEQGKQPFKDRVVGLKQ